VIEFNKHTILRFFGILGLVLLVQNAFFVSAHAQDTSIDDLGTVAGNGVRHVNAAEAKQVLDSDTDIVVLDVRTPVEFKLGQLEDAININYYSFSFKNQLSKLDREKTYLIHCHTGVRSGRTIPIMLAAGFKNIIHMDGGFKSWKDQGLPLAGD